MGPATDKHQASSHQLKLYVSAVIESDASIKEETIPIATGHHSHRAPFLVLCHCLSSLFWKSKTKNLPVGNSNMHNFLIIGILVRLSAFCCMKEVVSLQFISKTFSYDLNKVTVLKQ